MLNLQQLFRFERECKPDISKGADAAGRGYVTGHVQLGWSDSPGADSAGHSGVGVAVAFVAATTARSST